MKVARSIGKLGGHDKLKVLDNRGEGENDRVALQRRATMLVLVRTFIETDELCEDAEGEHKLGVIS
jgi:hypothetical protein